MKRKEVIQAKLIGLMEKERTTPTPFEKESILAEIQLLKWVLY